MTEYDLFAVELARLAGAAALPFFRAECGEQNKAAGDGFDPVTRADRDAEAAIRQAIAARWPDHGVIGEEYGEDRPDAEFVWVIDPVDGTRAFVAGLPLWTTLIALRQDGDPVVGAVPFADELDGTVGASVVHEHKTCRRVGARQQGVETLLEMLEAVPIDDQHVYERLAHPESIPIAPSIRKTAGNSYGIMGDY